MQSVSPSEAHFRKTASTIQNSFFSFSFPTKSNHFHFATKKHHRRETPTKHTNEGILIKVRARGRRTEQNIRTHKPSKRKRPPTELKESHQKNSTTKGFSFCLLVLFWFGNINVSFQVKELVNIFEIRDNIIHSVHGEVEITTQKIGKALGLSWNGDPFDSKVDEKTLSEEDLAVFKMFQGKHQADLTRLVLRTPVDTEANRILFKRAFLIFIQKCFLLATSSPNVKPRALLTLFGIETTRERIEHFMCMISYLKRSRRPSRTIPRPFMGGLVQTGRLRAGKERLERRNKDLKMGVLRRKDPESSESEPAESDSEEGYDFEEGSDESSSGGSSLDIDSENTMSEEMV
ncbi:hypothetical protein PIB30_018209 [Stylosanthes scabra]|uniref:Uncharacterized protein n=1 Tax=Stylosanthes scabra TaxID=79078 RepID=A0ABU6U7R7_9FABA|nr:hypothetical protein [Stylosanthes scabra]